MDKTKLIDLAFVQWVAELKSKPRGAKHVRSNFEELFENWKQIGATFDELYENYLPKAIKAHCPSSSMARGFYKNLKKTVAQFDKTEKEFIDEWNASIEAKGTEVFFEFFPAKSLDHDDEPKVFGNMSAQEYRAQRRYADQFPTLDTTELVKQWQQQQYNIDIDTMLENVLGDEDDETNS